MPPPPFLFISHPLSRLMKTPHVYDLAILGGGLAGLTAALIAARAGKSVLLLEKAPRLGGRATTQDTSGFLFNQGPHALYRAGAGAALLKRLGIAWSAARASYAGSWVIHEQRLYPMPGNEPAGSPPFLDEAGRGELLHFQTQLAQGTAIHAGDNRSVSQWLDDEIRHPLLRQLLEGQMRLSSYANGPEKHSAAALLKQMTIAAQDGVDYLDGGWQSLVAALESAAQQGGAEIHNRHAVQSLRQEENGFVLETANGSTYRARTVISTLPPAAIARLAGPAEVPSLQHWAETLIPVYAACLDLGLRSLPLPQHQFAIGLDRPHYYSVHTRSAKLAPEGMHLVQVAKYLAPGSEESAADLCIELEGIMDLIQPGWRSEVLEQRFLPHMLVTHALVTPAGRPPVSVPELSGLYLSGDWVGDHGMLADTSLASAEEATAAALNWLDAHPTTAQIAGKTASAALSRV